MAVVVSDRVEFTVDSRTLTAVQRWWPVPIWPMLQKAALRGMEHHPGRRSMRQHRLRRRSCGC